MKRIILQEKPTEIVRFFELDFYEEEDISFLKEILKKKFMEGEDIFFSCIREQTLTSSKELAQMRKYVPDYFTRNGRYCVISRIDSSRFHCCGTLKFSDETSDFIFKLCNYFLCMNFFNPKPSFTWNDLIEERGLFFRANSKRYDYILSNYINTLIIKGEDSDMFDILRRL
jgi:hypothetical protein